MRVERSLLKSASGARNPIPIQEFTDDLRHRLRAVWRDVEGVNPRDTYSKLATCQSLFAVPFDHNVRAPA
eukprot:730542-Pelagomonas_calceolata.AAC.1